MPASFKAAWPALALLVLWLAHLLLQCLPLPPFLVNLLSPEAARVHAAADYLDPGRFVTLSIDPHAAFVFWLKSCAYAVAFALALLLVNGRQRLVWLCVAIVVSGMLQAWYGSAMHLMKQDAEVLGTPILHTVGAIGTYVNRNHLAGLLEMSLAVGIGLMIAQLDDGPRRGWKAALLDLPALLLSRKAILRLALVLMVIALVMTRSRMGNTAFFSSLLVAGAIGLLLSRHATRGTVILIASLVVVDIFIVGAWFGVEQTLKRIGETTVQQAFERGDPASYALQIIRDYPVFGSGGGTFYTAYSRYRGEDIDAYYDHIHNDYVQFLAETGFVGAGLIGAVAVLSLACAVLAQARRRDPLARGIGFGVVMGVVAIGIHSAVDFNLQIPANAFLFVILLALGWVSLHLDRRKNAT